MQILILNNSYAISGWVRVPAKYLYGYLGKEAPGMKKVNYIPGINYRPISMFRSIPLLVVCLGT